MGVADIVLIVILLIAIIIGLKKGTAGIFFGFFGFIIIGVILGIVVNLAAPSIVFTDKSAGIHSSIGEKIYDPIYSRFPTDGAIGDLFHSNIIKDGDTLRLDTTLVVGENTIVNPTLEEILSSSESFIPAQATSVAVTIISMFSKEGQTLAMTLSNAFTIYAVGTIMWIIAAFVLTIIKNIIRRQVYKWLDSHSTASKIDRAVGMAIATIIIVCIVWGAGLFIKIQADAGEDWAVSATDYVNDNTLVLEKLNQANLLIMIVDGERAPDSETPTE
ncbi:MAG: hypothetical protein EOM87_04225 [Clostridia bacterium]|nr:hypothetical protein [Clostridia bacterium]